MCPAYIIAQVGKSAVDAMDYEDKGQEPEYEVLPVNSSNESSEDSSGK